MDKRYVVVALFAVSALCFIMVTVTAAAKRFDAEKSCKAAERAYQAAKYCEKIGTCLVTPADIERYLEVRDRALQHECKP